MVTRLPLQTVCDFVNTLELEDGSDRLDRSWLTARGLVSKRESMDADWLARAREVREALRTLARANAREDVDTRTATRVLDAQARRSGLAVRFGPGARLEPTARDADRALGLLLASVAAAMADGRWSRVKACRAETCRWVFYDRARSRSRRWCSMAVCGNREKARAYRSRRR